MEPLVSALLDLAHDLGRPDRDLSMLAEGNVSGSAGDGTFWVKGSGHSMGTLTAEGLVRVASEPILGALERESMTDDAVRDLLRDSTVEGAPTTPSVETFMHAYLLQLPGVKFVAHSHPTAWLSLLCTPLGRAASRARIFPDEIVLCGRESCWVPYCDPGFPLAKGIQAGVRAFASDMGELPRIILLESHGVIALGETTAQAFGAMLMADKAARIWLGSLAAGHPPRALTPDEVERIASRPDEEVRKALLWKLGPTAVRGSAPI
ncbi:MAG: class II aldolase/adducin family protein [Fimbriimonadaceae bacterium]